MLASPPIEGPPIPQVRAAQQLVASSIPYSAGCRPETCAYSGALHILVLLSSPFPHF